MARWIRDIFQAFRKQTPLEIRGTDLYGNRYFETTTASGKIRRSVKMVQKITPVDYSQETIPPEWDRWLRGLLDDPPTTKDQLKRVAENEVMKKRIADLENKENLISAEADAESTKSQGHASSRSFKGPNEKTDSPVSSGKDFTPSSWKPND